MGRPRSTGPPPRPTALEGTSRDPVIRLTKDSPLGAGPAAFELEPSDLPGGSLLLDRPTSAGEEQDFARSWQRCEEVLARLQVERQELQKGCSEWLRHLDKSLREQLEEQRRLLKERSRTPSKLEHARQSSKQARVGPQSLPLPPVWGRPVSRGQLSVTSHEQESGDQPMQNQHLCAPAQQQQQHQQQPQSPMQLLPQPQELVQQHQQQQQPPLQQQQQPQQPQPQQQKHQQYQQFSLLQRPPSRRPTGTASLGGVAGAATVEAWTLQSTSQAWEKPIVQMQEVPTPTSSAQTERPDTAGYSDESPAPTTDSQREGKLDDTDDTFGFLRINWKRPRRSHLGQAGARSAVGRKSHLRAQTTAWTVPKRQPLWHKALSALGLRGALGRMTAAMDDVAGAQEALQQRRMYKVIHSNTFQTMCSIIIVINAFFIGVSAQVTLDSEMSGRSVELVWSYLDAIFTCWFTVEIVLRLHTERLIFFFGQDWRWNLLDVFLVISSITDLTVNGFSGGVVSNMTAARILRLARFIRLARLARAVRAFHSFRIVVLGILESMASLYWCFMVVGFIVYMFAVFFIHGVTEHFHSVGGLRQEDALSQELKNMYGSVRQTMVTLFMTISGGIDWWDAMKPLAAIHWVYEPVFLFYIFFMFFAVLNVVIGTFVATTSEISKKDRDALVKTEMTRYESYAKKIKEFFHEADLDKSGMLSWQEFEAHLRNDRVKAYFQALELDVSQAYALFKILDVDGTDSVGLDEFVEGCARLKNQAKNLDIKLLMYQNEMVFTKLKNFMDFASQKFMIIEAQVTRSIRTSGLSIAELPHS